MVKKSILSAATAIAVMTTGAMAFDKIEYTGLPYVNLSDKGINNGRVEAAYFGGTQAANTMVRSASVAGLASSDHQKGDALVYAAFNQSDNWKTEITVRNRSENAVIAKAVLYDAEDSSEVLDFNIYLSANDVAKFTIGDGQVLTADGSIVKSVTTPYNQPDDSATFYTQGNKESIKAFSTKTGYVIVYAMVEADQTYHKNHQQLFKDYRKSLDLCRVDSTGATAWREAYITDGNMQQGMITFAANRSSIKNILGQEENADKIKEVSAANVDVACDDRDGRAYFGDPAADSLVGTARMYAEEGEQSRDLLLPALAIANFTDGNMILATEGEFVSFGDRTMKDAVDAIDESDPTSGPLDVLPDNNLNCSTVNSNINNCSIYDEAMIREDAKTFLVESAYFTFSDSKNPTNEADKFDDLLVVQPYKRTLVDLGNDDQYWSNLSTTNPYGGFTTGIKVFDEEENPLCFGIGDTIITSPYVPSDTVPVIYPELASVAVCEKPGEGREDKNGWADVSFFGKQGSGIPAIVTQMVGSIVDEHAQTNWVYAPVNRPVASK